MERIKFLTKDGVEIHGLYAGAESKNAPAVLLLHMMPAVKESWKKFQEKLRKAGFQSLAIDMRGHGESVWKNGERIDYKNFTDAEQQEKILDVEAAMRFLAERGVESESVAVAGASIGANLALQYQAEHSEIKAAVLLSSGVDYKGIKTEPLAMRVLPEQAVFLAGAKGDVRSRGPARQSPRLQALAGGASCADMASVLFNILPARDKKLKVFDGPEHGTDLFVTHPELMDEIVNWLGEIYILRIPNF